MNKLKLETFYTLSSSLGYELELRLGLTAGQPVRDELATEIRHHCYRIGELIEQSLILSDPEGPARRAAWLKRAAESFEHAGLAPIYIEQIPNEYKGPSRSPFSPWLMVSTRLGHFKLGWRKRVMHLDWVRTNITRDCDKLFATEDVTKGEKYIHAWSYEKLTEYLRALSAGT